MGQSAAFVGYFATPSKLFINQWTALHELILRDRPTSEQRGNDPEIIDDEALINTFNGPLSGFFRASMTQYRQISQQYFASHIANDEGLHGIEDLNKQLKLTDNDVKNISSAKLDKHQRALNTLIKEQYHAWEDFMHQAHDTVITALKNNTIPIADNEITEMHVKDNRAELSSRLTDLKLENFSSDTVLNISDYLRYKAIIAINNAFYRNQQPDEIAQIKQHMKRLKNTFSQLTSDEQQLLDQQKEAYAQLRDDNT